MCGIIGYYNLRRRSVDRTDAEVTALRDRMTSRGPDDAGLQWAPDRSWVLGHRRLSIIDLSPKGHQPMSSVTGRCHIVFNGEIYNYQALRRTLLADGYPFRSDSDTEVILALYEKYGVACLDHLDGMYAFMLVDETQGTAFLARDPVGKKPLYYAVLGDNLMFASDPGVIARDRACRREIDPDGLYGYLAMGGVKSPGSLFAGIRKLEPGGYHVIDGNFDGTSPVRRHPVVRYVPLESRIEDENAALELLDSALHEAVRKRMISDVPFGLFLSGGIDSSLILSYMSEHTDKVNTFSIETTGSAPERKEAEYAAELAGRYATRHHTEKMSEDDYIRNLDSVVLESSVPVALPDSALLLKLAELARKNGAYVVETGEGADELLFGYRDYLGRLERGPRVPGIFKHLAAGSRTFIVFFDAIARLLGHDRLYRAAHRLRALHERLPVDDYFYKPFWELQVAGVTGRDRRGPSIYRMLKEELGREFPDPPHQYGIDSLSYCWNASFRLADYVLDRVDRFTMYHSVEARAPFMDTGVINAAMRISPRLKQQGRWPKYILRKLAERRISSEHAFREKCGFGGGNDNMLTGGIQKYLRGRLSKSPSYRETPVIASTNIRTPTQLYVVCTVHSWIDKWL